MLLALPTEIIEYIIDMSLCSKTASKSLRAVCKFFSNCTQNILCARFDKYQATSNLWFITSGRMDIFTKITEEETLYQVISRCHLPFNARYHLMMDESERIQQLVKTETFTDAFGMLRSQKYQSLTSALREHLLLVQIIPTRKRMR